MRKLLLMVVVLASMAAAQSTVFYTDRALGVNPFGAGGTPSPVFISYGQVRVCGPLPVSGSPCTPVAPITDVNGNPLAIQGGNFGQTSTDVVGRFSFGCTPGLYLVQVAATGSNTPMSQYPITCPSGSSALLSSNNNWSGVNKFANVNSIVFVDGITNTTVQQAINSLPATGGWVMVPPGTYVGPTSIPSHVHLLGYVDGPPAATLNGATNFVLGLVPADQKTIFTYTSDLTLSDLYDTTIEGVTFDFGGNNAGLILSNGVDQNTFDIVIQNCGTGSALTLSGGSGKSVNINYFRRLSIYNAGKGIVMTAVLPQVVANNKFGDVIINNISATAIEFTQQADSNSFDYTFIAGLANTAKAIVFNNSGSPTLNKGSNDNVFRHIIIDAFDPPNYVGTLITINQSNGNQILSMSMGGGMTQGAARELAFGGTPTFTINYASDFTNPSAGNILMVKRIVGTGILHVAGDFALSVGWGATASSASISGTDMAGTVAVTAAGAGQAANPTVTLAFKDGSWGAAGVGSNNPICVASRGENSNPSTGFWAVTSTNTLQAVFTFFGTPVAGQIYTLDYVCTGTAR